MEPVYVPRLVLPRLLILTGTISIVAIGVLAPEHFSARFGPLQRWTLVAFGVLGSVGAIASFLPRRSGMTLTPSELILHSVFRASHLRWSDLGEFDVGEEGFLQFYPITTTLTSSKGAAPGKLSLWGYSDDERRLSYALNQYRAAALNTQTENPE